MHTLMAARRDNPRREFFHLTDEETRGLFAMVTLLSRPSCPDRTPPASSGARDLAPANRAELDSARREPLARDDRSARRTIACDSKSCTGSMCEMSTGARLGRDAVTLRPSTSHGLALRCGKANMEKYTKFMLPKRRFSMSPLGASSLGTNTRQHRVLTRIV